MEETSERYVTEERKRCVIVAGGDIGPIPQKGRGDFVIACDRGYEYAVAAGIEPDLLTGDLDSCSEAEGDIASIVYPREKDDTDTMLALRYAVSRGFEEAVICCAFGGRLDHTVANLQTAVYGTSKGLKVTIVGENDVLCMVCGKDGKEGCLKLPKRENWSISLFALDGPCSGINTRGLKYPMLGGALDGDFPLGVSNEWTEDEAEIRVGEGILTVIMSKIRR